MKLKTSQSIAGFTLSEMLVSLSLSFIVLAAAITCGVSLQKSFTAVDNYFSTQMQQIRIIDYLNRDVKRGLVVTTSVDLQSVTMSVRSEEHTSELQSLRHLVCRLLLEKKKP